MRAAIARLMGIVVLSVAASAGNALVRHVSWVPDLKAKKAAVQRHVELRATAGVTLDEFLALIDQGAVVIDTRPVSAFEDGHFAHTEALVLNVPADEVAEHLARLEDLAGCRFVLYCSSEACDSSEDAYAAMVSAGFDPADLFIYFPGWEGIVEAGLETAEQRS